MSIAAVTELSNEVRRLAIAGASLAKDDHRITKLIPALEKSGTKVPVFAKMAAAAKALVSADRESAPNALLALNALVMAVLKTQGKSSLEGEIQELGDSGISGNTHVSARMLEMVKDAMTETGQGRYQTIADAHKNGYFGDIRLAEATIEALTDSYTELADLAAEKLVPCYGQGLAPMLLAKLDPREKRPAARILAGLHKCDPEVGVQMARLILMDGDELVAHFGFGPKDKPSAEVKLAALQILPGSEEDFALLKDFLKARRKDHRIAAMERLFQLGHPEIEGYFLKSLEGPAKKADEALTAFSLTRSQQIYGRLREMASENLDKVEGLEKEDALVLVRILFILAAGGHHDLTTPLLLRAIQRLGTIKEKYGEESEDLHKTVEMILAYQVVNKVQYAATAIAENIRSFFGETQEHFNGYRTTKGTISTTPSMPWPSWLGGNRPGNSLVKSSNKPSRTKSPWTCCSSPTGLALNTMGSHRTKRIIPRNGWSSVCVTAFPT